MSPFESTFELILAAHERRTAPKAKAHPPTPLPRLASWHWKQLAMYDDLADWISIEEIAHKHGIGYDPALRRLSRIRRLGVPLERRMRKSARPGPGFIQEWRIKRA